MNTERDQLRMSVYAALFAAMMAAGAFIAVPVGPVPIVLQNLFVFLAGLALGPWWGLGSVAVYLLAGAFGLPVFSGGGGGIGWFAGPTGGYLLGYLPSVIVIGWISHKMGKKLAFDIPALIIGALIVYACGVPWLALIKGLSLKQGIIFGMLPFLIPDAVKIAAAVPIIRALRSLMGPAGALESAPAGQGQPSA